MNYFSAIFIFPDNTKARYVKLHSLWDERDENYNAINKSTYKGNIWNLFEVNYIVNGKENVWRYDSRGNRLTEVETYSTTSISKKEYEYYENSDLIKKAGNWYFNYDNNGNLLSRGNVAQYSNTDTFCSWDFAQKEGELWVYEYDLQNRLIKTSYSGKGKTNLKERASYTYDYKGLLVRKSYQDYDKSNYIELDKPTSSKEITEYYEYTLDGRVIYNERKDNSIVNKTDYIWANTTLWCEINEGVLYYHHTDHLGTTEVITDSNGNIVWHADYEAFGNVMNERGEENFTPNYTGKFFDESSGLYYFNARWYDCELGRFTSQDPARDGVNWWIYCQNNPLKYVDPTGMYSEDEIKSFKKSSAEEQMTFLKNEYNSVQSENSTNTDRGAKAAEMRELRDSMKLGKLFKQDENFMNGDLRDFLNLKEDGTMNYSIEDVKGKQARKAGWTELCSIGSQYHQSGAGDNNHLNAKFVNKDGREVVISYDRIVSSGYPDKGTFNYKNGNVFSSILWGGHNLYDMKPYDRYMSTSGISTEKKYNGIFSGGAWYGNSHYWK